MRTTTLLSTSLLTLLAPLLTTAVGNATISNHCTFPIYVQYTSPSNSGGTPVTLSPSGTYSTPATGSGVAIKVGTMPSLPHPMLLAYTLSSGEIYYDESTINGDPFEVQGFTLSPTVSTCHVIRCAPNESPCTDTYYPNAPSGHNPVYACGSAASLNLVTCG